MKKIRALIVLTLAATSIFAIPPSSAIGALYDGFNGDVACGTSGFFSISGNEVVMYSGSNCIGSVVIPDGVTAIGNDAFNDTFFGASRITSLTIPNSVTLIDDNAFFGANSLTSLTIPSSVNSIGDYAFFGANSLTELTILEGVTSIGSSAFANANYLTSLTIPDSVTNIGSSAFENASSITSLTISNNLTSIGTSTFANASSLISLDIPNSVTSIGLSAFSGASNLTSLTIPNSVISIGDNAFDSASNLISLTIPNSVTSIGGGAFFGASSLTSLIIGNHVTSIGTYAFTNISSLTSLIIPSSVISIGEGAFFGASALTSLVIGENVSAIGLFAFGSSISLTSFIYCGNVVISGSNSGLDSIIQDPCSTPDPPTSIAALATGATTADISFIAPAFNGGTSITSYTATSSPDGITASISQAESGTINISGLTAGTSYTFTVKATNSVGDSVDSLPSNSTTTVGIPNAPTSIVAFATGKRSARITLTNIAILSGPAITHYTVTSSTGGFIKTFQVTGSSGSVFSYEFTNLMPGTKYTFLATATNAVGTSAPTASNLITTPPLVVATISKLSFSDDGTGTGGKLIWEGKNIDATLFTGPETIYPGAYNYGAFSNGWNGRLRNLIPDSSYTVSIHVISEDGVGESKSLTFKTEPAPEVIIMDSAYWTKFVDTYVIYAQEAANMKNLMSKFDAIATSPYRAFVKVPTSRVSTWSVTSLTPKACRAETNGVVWGLTGETCSISYTISGPSKAPVTLVKDVKFTKFYAN